MKPLLVDTLTTTSSNSAAVYGHGGGGSLRSVKLLVAFSQELEC